MFGVDGSYSAEWAAWANAVAVRELDYHDTFLAAEYSHPGDNIPPLVAVAQQLGVRGSDLVRGVAARTRCRSAWPKESVCTSTNRPRRASRSVGRRGAGRHAGLDVNTIYQAIGQALHLTTATRQSRKGAISSWKAFAPALAGKVAIEAVDRAMRGEGSPAPIWEGEDGVIAWLLSGPEHIYGCRCPPPVSPSGPSWTATPKSIPPNTRARLRSTWPAGCV